MDRYMNAIQGAQGFPGEFTAKLLQGDDWRREAMSHSALQRSMRANEPAAASTAPRFGIGMLGAALVRIGTRMQGKPLSRMSSIVP